MKLRVKEIFHSYNRTVAELEKNTAEAATRGDGQIKDLGRLINKMDILGRLLGECDLEIKINPNDAQFLQ
ncbi:MAG: hypothetical protein US30_C0001G0056 [Candidatus Moranbacteria bacterium GW2011_GWF2_36_839]|nr:MAG: hypothetical protein US27_C0001G0056 [Candidatus Moranbacteria bacterium GW2011_GWF1_36_78]KKQ17722.1 MAG: hypothetical protein US30_C0001G0056 [Candidatus Moranbacteria bacterium GW2011_GWF2_36_839]HAT73424.1 hypothetical protein [Candidatus Moranbacteria bacterium]HBY10787.1 hypothetical protein [Candidatus Moranbacteria bacterium]